MSNTMNFHNFFKILQEIESFYWEYIGFSLVMLVGLYFSIKSKGLQFKVLGNITSTLKDLHADSKGSKTGTDPFKLYFATIGGMIGVGNIAGIVLAITLGGPGAIFWIWIATFAGMVIKYSEIFLGVLYRVKNEKNGFDGGPMYYLQHAFKLKYIPHIVCVLLCIYGAEVYQFTVLTDTLTDTFNLNRYLVITVLIITIVYSAMGGVHRLANFCSAVMPFFLIAYVLMCCWVIGQNFSVFLSYFPIIFDSAFNGHAALGGFAGSSMMMAAQLGTSKAVYSGDIGIGYDSIIQSETKAKKPQVQAKIAILALLSDSIIGTLSCFIVLVTGVWLKADILKSSEFVPEALAMYFPNADIMISVLMTIVGLATIIAYMVVGLKCAKFMNKKYGEVVYLIYAIFALVFFSFYDQTKVMLIMSISGGFLTLFNLIGIVKLRNLIKFN
jgi:alanine or glycine:cation symporter, AGCS family